MRLFEILQIDERKKVARNLNLPILASGLTTKVKLKRNLMCIHRLMLTHGRPRCIKKLAGAGDNET